MKYLAAFSLAALLLVGCSDDGANEAATSGAPISTSTTQESTTTSSTTTAAPTATTTVPPETTTTTAAATTTTSEAPPTTFDISLAEFTADAYGFFPDPLPGSDEAHGSGCAPGADQLPDGMWFGFIENATADSFSFDLACFWTGAAAEAAAAADGESEVYDFYIRNNTTQTRIVPRHPEGSAYWLDASGDLTPLQVPMQEWPVESDTSYQPCPGSFCAAWLYINGGQATEVIEQYLP